jgi:hypothetical protein
MAQDATDHEIPPRLRKPHDFHPVLPKHATQVQRLQARIQAPVNAVGRIINQGHWRLGIRTTGRRRHSDINILRLGSRIIDDDLVKAANIKVDRPPGRDGDLERDQLVMIPQARGLIRKLSSGGSVCHWPKLMVALSPAWASARGAASPRPNSAIRHMRERVERRIGFSS